MLGEVCLNVHAAYHIPNMMPKIVQIRTLCWLLEDHDRFLRD